MTDTDTKAGKAAIVGAIAVVVIALGVLAGWLFDLDLLRCLIPGLNPMNPTTAAVFICAGASLALFLRFGKGEGRKSRVLILVARLLALAVTLAGLAKLTGYLRGVDLGFDQWLFTDKLGSGHYSSLIRIAPNTAFNFFLIGSALLFVDVRNQYLRFLLECFVAVVSAGALLGALGYAYQIEQLYEFSNFAPMSLFTSVTFLIMCAAFFLSHMNRGWVAIFAKAMDQRDTFRLTISFGLLAAVLLLVGWQGLSRLRQFHQEIEKSIGDQWAEVKLAHEALRLSNLNGRITLTVFLLNDPNEIKQLLAERASNTDRISQLMETLKVRLDPVDERPLFDRVQATRTPYVESYKQALALFLTANKRDEARNMMMEVVRPKLLSYHEAWNAFDKLEGEQIDRTIARNNTQYIADQRDFLLSVGVAGMVAALIAVFTIWLMGREIAVRTQAEKSLQSEHDKLEQRVLERTAELTRSNEKLNHEITERIQAEESLKLLTTAVQQAKDSFLITNAELDLPGPKILFVNPAFTTMTGYTAAEIIGKTPRLLQGPRTDKAVLRRLRQNLENGEVFEGNAINYRKDGQEFDMEWQIAPIRDTSEKITHFVAIQRDITERKLAEANIVRLRNEHESILNSISEGMHWIDLEGHIKYENRASAKMLGYEISELIGKPGHLTMHHSHADGTAYPAAECPICTTLKDGVSRRVKDEVFWRKDGTGFPVEYTSNPVLAENGQLVGTVVVFNDVTELKLIQARMFQSQKMETVGKLAGGVAHEFNSILTAIIGQSELLLGELPPDGKPAQSATEIRKAADRAATLTRQLLAYGRKQILQPEILDLNVVLAGMKDTLSHLMGRGVDLRLIPAKGLNTVKIDPGQFEQVILNIAMNAADAMPNGGIFTLETSNVILDEEYVHPFPELKPGSYSMLALTDTGVGMSEKVRARAFDPFFSTKGVGEGTGLGLATCYGILKQSNGHMSLYSEEARGTTFKIYLPQVDQPTTTPLVQSKTSDSPRGTETILLAEDDPFLLKMSAAFLGQQGYTVITAINGVEALSLKNKPGVGHIDLLLTDVVMPHMSGKELADRIRATYPHTKILYTSAYTENAIVHQGVLNDGVKFLQKPFTPTALANKVREVLDQPPS